MVPAVAPSVGSDLSCLPGDKVRLRLSYGGSFIMVRPRLTTLSCLSLGAAHVAILALY
jgi:hypothetical protein